MFWLDELWLLHQKGFAVVATAARLDCGLGVYVLVCVWDSPHEQQHSHQSQPPFGVERVHNSSHAVSVVLASSTAAAATVRGFALPSYSVFKIMFIELLVG